MPPRFAQLGRSGLLQGVVLTVLATSASSLSGQEEPQLLRDYPREGPYYCAEPVTPAQPTADQRARAEQLASDALQAQILGDMEGARSLLRQATEADPSDPELAYRHARVLEDLGLLNDAILEFCRSLALGAEESGIDDGRTRLDTLYEIVRDRLSEVARQAFVGGLASADIGLLEDANASFSVAIDEAPDWPTPVYNRAVVRERMGLVQESLADYRRYLEMVPTEIDPVVATVSQRIGLLEGAATAGTPSPAGALALGMLPGVGHYYSGRPIGGTVVLALAGGAMATGLFVKDVTVVCVSEPPPGQDCPPTDVHDRITERPLLLPSMGVAAAVTLLGAIDALVKARRRRNEVIGGATTVAAGPTLRAPSVSARGARIDLSLLRVTFR